MIRVDAETRRLQKIPSVKKVKKEQKEQKVKGARVTEYCN
jgi:hypothetical protein